MRSGAAHETLLGLRENQPVYVGAAPSSAHTERQRRKWSFATGLPPVLVFLSLEEALAETWSFCLRLLRLHQDALSGDAHIPPQLQAALASWLISDALLDAKLFFRLVAEQISMCLRTAPPSPFL